MEQLNSMRGVSKMAEIKSLLDGVIETTLQDLESLSPDEQSEAIRNLATLHKLRIEEIKAEIDAEDKRERREGEKADRDREEQVEKHRLSQQIIDRYVDVGIKVAELVLPLVCYGVWMRKGFKFEETGTFTSATFKNLINRFRPTKRG